MRILGSPCSIMSLTRHGMSQLLVEQSKCKVPQHPQLKTGQLLQRPHSHSNLTEQHDFIFNQVIHLMSVASTTKSRGGFCSITQQNCCLNIPTQCDSAVLPFSVSWPANHYFLVHSSALHTGLLKSTFFGDNVLMRCIRTCTDTWLMGTRIIGFYIDPWLFCLGKNASHKFKIKLCRLHYSINIKLYFLKHSTNSSLHTSTLHAE